MKLEPYVRVAMIGSAAATPSPRPVGQSGFRCGAPRENRPAVAVAGRWDVSMHGRDTFATEAIARGAPGQPPECQGSGRRAVN